MSSKLRFVSVLLVAALMVSIGCSIVAFEANAQTQTIYRVLLRARHQNGACVDIGTIVIDQTPYVLPTTAAVPSGEHTITFPAPSGCDFIMWEVESTDSPILVEDAKALTTKMRVRGDGGILRVIYRGTCCGVGGVVAPTNTYTALAPYLAVIGLVATGAAVAIKKRKR